VPVPREPEGAEAAYRDFQELVLPNPMGNIHPRFWSWVIGTGTPLGMLSDMLAAGLNSNAGGFDQGSTYVELQVIDWCKEMLGFPAEASGLLVSGGAVANLVGLAVGRNAAAGFDIREKGVRGFEAEPVVYGSTESHNSVNKAVEILGLGSDAFRGVPVDAAYRIDIVALEKAIARDRREGRQPLILVATAGTVNTAATDDIETLAAIARRERMWLHVDGAFGALAALSPELRPMLRGIEQADSLAFDLHKWMYVPYEVGGVLVRDPEVHRRAFTSPASYLAPVEKGLPANAHLFSDYGLQLSRGFRALKVWMSIKEHGIEKYGRLIRQNVAQARYLASLRYVGAGGSEEELNDLNRKILGQLQEDGIAAPSYTTLDGKFAIRAAITNHRSRNEDFEILADAVSRLGRELASS